MCRQKCGASKNAGTKVENSSTARWPLEKQGSKTWTGENFIAHYLTFWEILSDYLWRCKKIWLKFWLSSLMYGNQASASSVLGFAAGFWWKPLSADFPSHQTEHNQVPYFGCFWSAAIIIAHSVFDFVETWVHMSPKICFALFMVVHKLLNRRWGGGGVSPNDYKITWGSRVLSNDYSIIEEYTNNIISAKKKKINFPFHACQAC